MINNEKIVRYYTKVVEQSRKAYGEDWRTVQYQNTLDRIHELLGKQSLTKEEQQFMENRNAMAEVFGR